MEEIKLQEKEVIENVKQVNVTKRHELLGSVKPQKNHILFQYNWETEELTRASFTELEPLKFEDAVSGASKKRRTVVIEPGCTYASALNEKNALKKIMARKN